jgi:hypothetical protein
MKDKLFVVGRKVNDKIHDDVVQQEDRIRLNNKSILIQDLRNYLFIVEKKPGDMKRGSFIVIESRIVERMTKKYRGLRQERYNSLLEIKNDESKMRRLYNFLKTFDISKFDPKIRPGETVKVVDNIEKKRATDNLIPYTKFVVEEIETLSSKKDWRIPELYQMSITYSKGNYTERWFAMQFKKVFGEFQMLNSNRQSVYNFDDDADVINKAINNYLT